MKESVWFGIFFCGVFLFSVLDLAPVGLLVSSLLHFLDPLPVLLLAVFSFCLSIV